MGVATQILIGLAALLMAGPSFADAGGARHLPNDLQCPVGAVDPSCEGSARVGIRVPVGQPHVDEHAIFGDCEMVLPNGHKIRPCRHIKLVLEGVKGSERHTIEVTGPHFEFKKLSGPAYRLRPASDRYQLLSGDQELAPGQTVKVQLEVKPKK